MHDLKDSQTGMYAGKHDRSMRTKRRIPKPDCRSPNCVQPDGTLPKAPHKRRFTPTRKPSK